jgi:hypothetical protein
MHALADLLRRHLRPSDTFIDIGAKNGVGSALIASEVVGRSGRVIAIEPDRYRYERLCFNVAFSGRQNIRCLRLAPPAHFAFHQDGVARLYRLQDLLSQLHVDEVALLKIDAPGSELEIISGMGALLTDDDAPSLILQLEDSTAELFRRLEDLLHAADYELTQFGSIMVARSPKTRARQRRSVSTRKTIFQKIRNWRLARPVSSALIHACAVGA